MGKSENHLFGKPSADLTGCEGGLVSKANKTVTAASRLQVLSHCRPGPDRILALNMNLFGPVPVC